MLFDYKNQLSINSFMGRNIKITLGNSFAKGIEWVVSKTKKQLCKIARIASIFLSKARVKTAIQKNSGDCRRQSYRRFVLAKTRKRDHKKSQSRTAKNFLKFLSTDQSSDTLNSLQCPICIEIIADSSLTPCGHLFCTKCLNYSLVITPKCPFCRNLCASDHIFPCKDMDLLIEKLVQNSGIEMTQKTFERRKQQALDWKKNRQIDCSQLKKGDNIDLMDLSHKWITGVVTEILKNQHGQPEQLIVKLTESEYEYNPQQKSEHQTFNIKSRRIAPYLFFTKKKVSPIFSASRAHEWFRNQQISANVQIVDRQDYSPELILRGNYFNFDDQISVYSNNSSSSEQTQRRHALTEFIQQTIPPFDVRLVESSNSDFNERELPSENQPSESGNRRQRSAIPETANLIRNTNSINMRAPAERISEMLLMRSRQYRLMQEREANEHN